MGTFAGAPCWAVQRCMAAEHHITSVAAPRASLIDREYGKGAGGPGTLSTDATKGDRQKLAIPAHTKSLARSSAIWLVRVVLLSC